MEARQETGARLDRRNLGRDLRAQFGGDGLAIDQCGLRHGLQNSIGSMSP